MKKPKLKRKTRNRMIMVLAFAHHYVSPVLIILLSLLWGGANWILFAGIGNVAFAVYTFVGYKLHWKHIYCSYQSANRKEMTPDNIRWGTIKKSDAYCVPIIFGVAGVACIVCHFLFVHM